MARSAPDRRGAILAAALACFTRHGYAGATMEQICRKARASTGSVYHHFGDKAGLAGALYLEGLRDYHEGLRAKLPGFRNAEALVRGIVLEYGKWVTAHPDWARFLLEQRRAESVQAVEREIRALTRSHLARLREAFEPHVRSGAIARFEPDVYVALILGPVQTLASVRLPRRRLDALREATPLLADAAWRSVRARPARRRRS